MSSLRDRLEESGWSLTCERLIDIGTDDDGKGRRSCTWRATKGIEQLVVRSKLGEEQVALRYLYDMAKTIDPDLQQIAMESGSGGWVFDLDQAESDLDGI